MAAAPFISSTYPFPTWLTSTSQRGCRSGCRAYCRPRIPASRYVIQRLLLLNVPGFQVWCASARRAAMACRKSSPRHGIRLADCHVEHAAPFSPSQVPLSVNLSFGTCGTHRYVSCTHYTRYISSKLVPSYTVSLSHTAQPPTHPVVITIPSANARAAAALIRCVIGRISSVEFSLISSPASFSGFSTSAATATVPAPPCSARRSSPPPFRPRRRRACLVCH